MYVLIEKIVYPMLIPTWTKFLVSSVMLWMKMSLKVVCMITTAVTSFGQVVTDSDENSSFSLERDQSRESAFNSRH